MDIGMDIPNTSITYPSYDQWLEARGLPPNTPPTPIGVDSIDLDYRLYLEKPEDQQIENIRHRRYQRGEINIYGTHSQDDQILPRVGPAHWHLWYPTFIDLGPNSWAPFSRSERFENILGSFGYILGDNIVSGDDNIYDNQVWKVSKFQIIGEEEHQTAELVEYACKIVHVRNFNYLSVFEAGNQVLKEANVLFDANHQNIMKVFDNIYIEDNETNFPYLFIASIMELMEGNVDLLIRADPGRFLSDEHCHWLLKDMAEAIDYLHNGMRGPNGERVRIVHMAIRTANILYKRYSKNERNRFKLADFEECIIYDRHFTVMGRPDLWHSSDPNSLPPDVLPDPNRIPYALSVSAPEILAAQQPFVDRTNIRTMPNDVFCLASSIVFCKVKNRTEGETRAMRMIQMMNELHDGKPPPPHSLENLLLRASHPNPKERSTIREVLNHPYMTTPQNFGKKRHPFSKFKFFGK